MTEDIKYKGPWRSAYLCSSCGEYLSNSVTCTHWGKPCHRCGQVGTYCPDSIHTSRRFICTRKRLFSKDLGYYEWSGRIVGDKGIEEGFIDGRVAMSPTITIAAAGLASGLF